MIMTHNTPYYSRTPSPCVFFFFISYTIFPSIFPALKVWTDLTIRVLTPDVAGAYSFCRPSKAKHLENPPLQHHLQGPYLQQSCSSCTWPCRTILAQSQISKSISSPGIPRPCDFWSHQLLSDGALCRDMKIFGKILLTEVISYPEHESDQYSSFHICWL